MLRATYTQHAALCCLLSDTNNVGMQEDYHDDIGLDVMKAAMQDNQRDL